MDMKKINIPLENSIIINMYTYSEHGIKADSCRDISKYIIDYSYECSINDNIRQTANITVKVDTDETLWFMRRENKVRVWITPDKTINAVTWSPWLYHLIKTYKNYETEEIFELDLGYFIPVSDEYNYDPISGTISISLSGMSTLLLKEYGGSVLTARVGTITIDPDTKKETTMMLPLTLSVEEGTDINSPMIDKLIRGSDAVGGGSILNKSHAFPIQGVILEEGQRFWQMPYTLDFDPDVSRDDMVQQIVDIAFNDGHYWVDEDRYFHISSKAVNGGNLIARWSDYAHLFRGESVSYDDSGHFNITEVYGKDNMYYGICEEQYLDGGTKNTRKQTIHADELQSNEECEVRAQWENYKAFWGGMTVNVTLYDRYIPQFTHPSNRIGKVIEYMTVDGDVNLYFLNKLSFTNDTITMELSVFNPADRNYAEREHPYTKSHEIINNNTIRLNIDYTNFSGNENSAVKLYESGKFVTVVKVKSDNGNTYIDYPIDHNGTYKFQVSPYDTVNGSGGFYGGESNTQGSYAVTVTDYVVPSQQTDPDPYPHPNLFEPTEEHAPYIITTDGRIVTAKDGKKITV